MWEITDLAASSWHGNVSRNVFVIPSLKNGNPNRSETFKTHSCYLQEGFKPLRKSIAPFREEIADTRYT